MLFHPAYNNKSLEAGGTQWSRCSCYYLFICLILSDDRQMLYNLLTLYTSLNCYIIFSTHSQFSSKFSTKQLFSYKKNVLCKKVECQEFLWWHFYIADSASSLAVYLYYRSESSLACLSFCYPLNFMKYIKKNVFSKIQELSLNLLQAGHSLRLKRYFG